ncbi:DMT family transporter [Rarobacter faecitabidus]|uniref:Transporter family-2 protein n=1 Tax=Rarobacter faecitabidus TaxID=13243 RepID=A0A542ZAM4_RARFA|nr:DMT family transporter [Rarobacter faecitabidus]TQL57383.1 transporter family-2 protein [Rarobacter faecitabidus]
MLILAALATALIVGCLLPVQTAINTRLSRVLASTWLASLTSFAIGTVALGVAVAIARPSLDEFSAADQPWWLWIGGVCGVVYLTLNMVLMHHLGAATAVVIPVVGQIVGGVIIDAFALVGATQHSLNAVRVIGAGLVIGGAWVSSKAIAESDGKARARRAWLLPVLVAMGIGGGFLSSIQTAVNGTLGVRAGSPIFAALVSFLVGTACLLVINLAARTWRSVVTADAERPRPALFAGGLLGALFVAGAAYAAPTLGTSMTVSLVLLGQLVASLLIDHFGWLGARRRPVTRTRLMGAGIVLVGVALVRLLG